MEVKKSITEITRSSKTSDATRSSKVSDATRSSKVSESRECFCSHSKVFWVVYPNFWYLALTSSFTKYKFYSFATIANGLSVWKLIQLSIGVIFSWYAYSIFKARKYEDGEDKNFHSGEEYGFLSAGFFCLT